MVPYTSTKNRLITELLKPMDLENFLKEPEGEWWSPYEIGKKLGADIRTVKKVIRRLKKMTQKGWKLAIAERGERLFCVRLERDMENSGNLVKAEVSDVEVGHTNPKMSSEGQQELCKYLSSG